MFAKTVGVMRDSLLHSRSFLEIFFCVMLNKHCCIKRRTKVTYLDKCIALHYTRRDGPVLKALSMGNWCTLGVAKNWLFAIIGVSGFHKTTINVQGNLNINRLFSSVFSLSLNYFRCNKAFFITSASYGVMIIGDFHTTKRLLYTLLL